MFSRMNRELERADLIIVLSQFCKDSMVLNGLPEEKIMVNIMGVDTNIFKKRQQLPPKPRFITVGTICLRKGHQYLFRAFQKVKQVLPEAELICVGQYKTDFRMERPKWEGTFTHIPSLPPAGVAEHLQNATAFVFPSQEEGLARVEIEALASGLPVIGTYPGGATTIVRDGVEGFIVPPHDVNALADAMVRVATDADLNRRMSEAAYQQGAVRNSWQDYGDRLLAEYASRLKKKAGKSSRSIQP
jgi:glycosyltransferase involved in cell wall biosynthesis